MKKIITAPSHTQDAFDVSTMPRIVRWAEEEILKLRADAIVACGHSGLLIAGAVSYLTRLPVFAVRKPEENPVAGYVRRVSAVTENGPAKRWVWLDDFCSGGNTIRNAIQEIWSARLVENPYPVGLVLYREYGDAAWQIDDYRLRLRDIYINYDWATAPATLVVRGFRT